MPYNYFAESFNRLEDLIKLVKRLEELDEPLKELRDDHYLPAEFSRIKASASRDVLIFGSHSSHYIRLHLFLVYDMMISLMELLRKLPEAMVMGERDLYLYKHGNKLCAELENLALFYETLGELIS